MSTSEGEGVRYAWRTSLKAKEGLEGALVEKMRNEIFPALKSQDGIRRMYLLRAPAGNEFVLFTLWDSKSDADAYASHSSQDLLESIRDFVDSEPIRNEFDVELHSVNAKDLPPPQTARKQSRTKKKHQAKRRRKK
jgi:heme-degrading monooxygenase HmoA